MARRGGTSLVSRLTSFFSSGPASAASSDVASLASSSISSKLSTSAASATATTTTSTSTVMPIMRMGNPVLRVAARPWTREEIVGSRDEVRNLVRSMTDTMFASEGVGLAAPQVGISKQLVIVHLPRDPTVPGLQEVPLTTLFNPKVTVQGRATDKIPMIEGCLSVPGLVGKVWRHRYVRVDYMDEEGRNRRLEASGFIAGMLQHEIDHLNATLYVDRVKPGELHFREEFEQYGREDLPLDGTIQFIRL